MTTPNKPKAPLKKPPLKRKNSPQKDANNDKKPSKANFFILCACLVIFLGYNFMNSKDSTPEPKSSALTPAQELVVNDLTNLNNSLTRG